MKPAKGELQPFRQGLVFDVLSDGRWWRQSEVCEILGCSSTAMNKAFEMLKKKHLIEHDGRGYKLRRFRLLKGAKRPEDKRLTGGFCNLLKGPTQAPTWDFTPPLLAQVWCYADSVRFPHISASLDTLRGKSCPEITQAAD